MIIKYPCHSLSLDKLVSRFADDLYSGGEWNCPNKPDGESRISNFTPTVADALRDLSGALVRLADTLEEDSSNSLEQ